MADARTPALSRSIIEARLVSDTRETTHGAAGVLALGLAERRLLFELGDAFLELRLPAEATVVEDGGWVHGKFLVPDDPNGLYPREVFVVLQSEFGVTGAVRTSRSGEFSVPFSGTGRFVLDVESSAGRIQRARFTP